MKIIIFQQTTLLATKGNKQKNLLQNENEMIVGVTFEEIMWSAFNGHMNDFHTKI